MSSTPPPGPPPPDTSQPGDATSVSSDPLPPAPETAPPASPPLAPDAWAAPPPPPPPASAPPVVAWESPEVVAGPAPGIEFAPHGARLVAYILGSVIITIIVFAYVVVGLAVLGVGSTVEDGEIVSVDAFAAVVSGIILIVGTLVAVLYFPFFWARGGSTIGMRPFNLRVVRDRDGGRIGWGTAILRLIGLTIAGAVFYIGYIWIFIDKRRRGWQDLIAGTVVIKQG